MALTTINVWLDVIFSALYVCVVAFLVFHFALFVYFGRFRKAFIEGNWPSHDSRPPATPKVLHAVHMTSMLLLGLTGMYLRFPFFAGGRTFMRGTHYVFMIAAIVTTVWRVWYAFRSKTNADWREFAIGKKDLQSALGVLAYYGYFSNNKPHVAKYNVLQKMSYVLFLVMMVVQAITGLALVRYGFIFGVSPSQLLVGWWASAFGGMALVMWVIRTLHYVLNWAFLIMMTVHLYLAATVDVPCALDFFGVAELQVDPDAHGHGPAETPVLTPEFQPTT
jgi:Ni/Fe-hydrogenase 1 B-type cytochrome subunit